MKDASRIAEPTFGEGTWFSWKREISSSATRRFPP